MTSIPGLKLKAMSGSVALPQLGFVWTPMSPDTIKSHVDARGLGCHLHHVGT